VTKKLPLSDALRVINADGGTLTYQQFWNAAISGKIPAERVGQRWAVRETDLDTIAQTFTST
jgi:uncharacterized protein YfaP (DUF2135 family)